MQFSFYSIPFLTGVLKIKPHLHAPKAAPPLLFLATQFCVFLHTRIHVTLHWGKNCPLGSLWPGPVVPPHKHWNHSCDTSAQRRWERQHWFIRATPQEKPHPKFQLSWKSPSTAHKHSPQEGAAVLSATPQGNTNKLCCGVPCTIQRAHVSCLSGF